MGTETLDDVTGRDGPPEPIHKGVDELFRPDQEVLDAVTTNLGRRGAPHLRRLSGHAARSTDPARAAVRKCGSVSLGAATHRPRTDGSETAFRGLPVNHCRLRKLRLIRSQ